MGVIRIQTEKTINWIFFFKDITTYRQNRSRGRFSEIMAVFCSCPVYLTIVVKKSIEYHQNCIIRSKVTQILLKGQILPIHGVALKRICACSLRRSKYKSSSILFISKTIIYLSKLELVLGGVFQPSNGSIREYYKYLNAHKNYNTWFK